MTGQYIIDFLFLFILVCHIFKIQYLQEENKRMWIDMLELLKKQQRQQKAIRELHDISLDIIRLLPKAEDGEDND